VRALAYLSRWLELLGLGVWIGGMVILGSLVAPTVFNTVNRSRWRGGNEPGVSKIQRRAGLCLYVVALGFLGKLS
jgi:uncharacterized membrane protein